MIANKKKFSVGLGMLAAFIVILIIIFMPIFGGQNALDTLDSLLFQKAAAMVNINGPTLKVSGDLGRILTNCLEDADLMYANKSLAVSGKYGYDARQVLYNWWTAAKEMDKDLKNQKLFKEAKLVTASKKKAIEMAYNYYKIEPSQIGSRYGVVIFSLIFYVVYTLWYGFAIMYLFEGWGLQLEH
jgi:hypothetical protein